MSSELRDFLAEVEADRDGWRREAHRANTDLAVERQVHRDMNWRFEALLAAAHAVVDGQRWCGRCGRRVEDDDHAADCPVGALAILVDQMISGDEPE